jgi:hypothetical protein
MFKTLKQQDAYSSKETTGIARMNAFKNSYNWYQNKIKEQLYFARNTRSRTPGAVLGTTCIYIKLMHLSVEDVCFGIDFISLLQFCRR